KAVILNYTRNPERRFTFELGVDADDDPGLAMETGLAALGELAFPLADPPPQAWIEKVGDSNIVITFAAWIDQQETDFVKAKSAAIRAVKNRLEDDGFTLPEPIYRIRVDKAAALLSAGDTPEAAAQAPAEPTETEPRRRVEESADTSRDRTIEEKVREDRAAVADDDLLSEEAPTEFGDTGTNGGSV
ncbi:MAG: MscS mechanosensitive ion channel, partial [Pseudomonadota bacterium]